MPRPISGSHRTPSTALSHQRPSTPAEPQDTHAGTAHAPARGKRTTTRSMVKAGEETALRALSVRQPWAELIMRGQKTIEVRTLPTHIRGKVQIYASERGIDPAEEARVEKDYGVHVDALPRGVLVGTVEIVGCHSLGAKDEDGACFDVSQEPEGSFGWQLAHPERAHHPVKPERHPQPVFFKPF